MKHWPGWMRVFGIVAAVALLIGGGLWLRATILAQNANVKTVAISDILALSNNHDVRTASVDSNYVQVTTLEGQKFQAVTYADTTLVKTLSDNGATVTLPATSGDAVLRDVLQILTFLFIAGLIFWVVRKMSPGSQARLFAMTKARIGNGDRPEITFVDVAGAEEAKQELAEIVEFLKSPEKFTTLGARIPKGVLLVGPPGTGKTLISKAVAGEAGVPFFNMSGSEFVEMFVGVGASRVRNLFKEAKKAAPAIIFVDEIDAVGRHRGAGTTTGNEEREQTLNQLLVEMDGFGDNTSVIIMAATNRPDILDHALLRPGRFDRQVTLDLPDLTGRAAILAVHAKGKPLGPDIDLHDIAKSTTGFSGADLANLVNEAALLAARRGRPHLTMSDIDESVMRVMAGPERKSRLISDAEKTIIAYHEVGHALVAKTLPGTDPVTKVSTISRGMALGMTMQRPSEDRYLTRRSEIVARMAAAMGGRAAEELIFGDVTTGASNDIEHATKLAKKMVCELGMSGIGPITLKQDDSGHWSEELSRRVDAEMLSLLEEAHDVALTVLRRRQEELVAIAEHLQKVETIDGDELDRLLAQMAPTLAQDDFKLVDLGDEDEAEGEFVA